MSIHGRREANGKHPTTACRWSHATPFPPLPHARRPCSVPERRIPKRLTYPDAAGRLRAAKRKCGTCWFALGAKVRSEGDLRASRPGAVRDHPHPTTRAKRQHTRVGFERRRVAHATRRKRNRNDSNGRRARETPLSTPRATPKGGLERMCRCTRTALITPHGRAADTRPHSAACQVANELVPSTSPHPAHPRGVAMWLCGMHQAWHAHMCRHSSSSHAARLKGHERRDASTTLQCAAVHPHAVAATTRGTPITRHPAACRSRSGSTRSVRSLEQQAETQTLPPHGSLTPYPSTDVRVLGCADTPSW